MELLEGLLAGDRRALARSLTLAESRGPGYRELLRGVAPHGGRAHRVGVTGAPGVGKSTLVSALVRVARERGQRVAVLAVDPSSPFTGGALLGDRVRMTEHLGDEGVFVRSMASRGAQGGLSAHAGSALDLLDAAGFDVLLIETVGAGQVDVDVADEAETTLVLLAPGAGDHIQAMKSGLLEVADVWIVNKADQPGAERVRADLLASLALHEPPDDLEDRIVLVSASTGDGIGALLDLLQERAARLGRDPGRKDARHRRLRRRVLRAARELLENAMDPVSPGTRQRTDQIASGARSVDATAEGLIVDVARTLGGIRWRRIMSGRKIRVLVAKPGLDGHDRGAKVVAAALRDAGMEVIYTGLHQTPEMIVEAALQEDVDVIGLSVHSGAHMALFRRVMKLMKSERLENVLLTGGGIIPAVDVKVLRDEGCGRLFGPGTSTSELVDYIRGEVAPRLEA